MARPRKYHTNPNREAAEACRLRRRFRILCGSFFGLSLVDYLRSQGCDISKHSVVPTIRVADFQRAFPDISFDDARAALKSSGYVRIDLRRGTIKVLTTQKVMEKK